MQPSNKKVLPTFIFCTFLGIFGAHRFYAGRTATAVIMLILTLSFIGIFVSAIWTFIDWIIVLSGNLRDSEGMKISQWV